MSETFNTRHSVSGKIQRLTADQIEPFAEYLEIVADDAKPFEPGLFKPGKVGEFTNPSPTLSVDEAQAAYDALLESGKSPQTKEAKEAKKALDAAVELAEESRLEAEQAAADAQAESERLAAEANQTGEPTSGASPAPQGE